jgi:hypothetical protein
MCSWNGECSAFHFDKIGQTCSLGAKDDLALISSNFIPHSLGLLQTKLNWSPGAITLTQMSYSLIIFGITVRKCDTQHYDAQCICAGVISSTLFSVNLLTLFVR